MTIQYRDPKESTNQIKRFAYRVLSRLHSLGAASHTLDDVEQELWIAWCKACEAYKPDAGASFKTFLARGMQLHINRYVEKNFERFYDETVALSLEASPGSSDDENISLADVVPSHDPLPDEVLEEQDNFDYAMSRLSPHARQFLTFLKDQPRDVLDEVRKFDARREYAREMGIHCAGPQHLTSYLVFDLMGVSRPDRRLIIDEIEQLAQIMSDRVEAI